MNDTRPDKVNGDILIVDDDLNNLKLLSNILGEQGYEVRGAQNGPTALTFIDKDPPELVLLDIRMPDMDGYDVCKRLKVIERHRRIPVIFLSALQETDEKAKGFKAGAVDFITKPFQAEEVLVRVNTHLTLSRLQKNLDQQIENRAKELAENEEKRLLDAYSEIEQLKQKLEQENVYLLEEVELQHRQGEIRGQSKAALNMLSQAEEVAVTDQVVLLKDIERNHILKILKQTGWRIRGKNGAAELLGLKPTTLDSRMKKLGIVRLK